MRRPNRRALVDTDNVDSKCIVVIVCLGRSRERDRRCAVKARVRREQKLFAKRVAGVLKADAIATSRAVVENSARWLDRADSVHLRAHIARTDTVAVVSDHIKQIARLTILDKRHADTLRKRIFAIINQLFDRAKWKRKCSLAHFDKLFAEPQETETAIAVFFHPRMSSHYFSFFFVIFFAMSALFIFFL